MRPLIKLVAIVLALTTLTSSAAAQSAPTPVAAGTLRAPSTDAAWGSWEAFTTETNMFGFWLRFRRGSDRVYTVVPFEVQADGQIACWYIEYQLTGTSDPNRAEGWQWHEVAGGRVLLNPATATSTSIDGAMARTYQMIGYSRQPEQNAQFQPIRLTVP